MKRKNEQKNVYQQKRERKRKPPPALAPTPCTLSSFSGYMIKLTERCRQAPTNSQCTITYKKLQLAHSHFALKMKN